LAGAADLGRPRARYGHLGMRERVALFHGRLKVGPRVAGGYEVVAFLPLDLDRS
jgi:signal transduction histidine kinase